MDVRCTTSQRSWSMGAGTPSQEWESTLTDLYDRRVVARAMGGEDRLAKHRAAGKLDARARVDYLLDPRSFQELSLIHI